MYIGEKKGTKEKRHRRFYLGMTEYVLIYSQYMCLSVCWDSFLVFVTFLGKLISIKLCEALELWAEEITAVPSTGLLHHKSIVTTAWCTWSVLFCHETDSSTRAETTSISVHCWISTARAWRSVNMLAENLSKSIVRPVKKQGKVIRSKHFHALWTFLYVFFFFLLWKRT